MKKEEVPVGFSMALVMNPEAMQKFGALSEEQKQQIIAGTFPGFKQWFILQHWNDLEGSVQPEPFVTNVSFFVPISGTYE